MSEDVIADKLNDIMLNAITTTPKGDVIPDYKAMLEAIKVRHKFRRRGPETVIAFPMMFGNSSGQL